MTAAPPLSPEERARVAAFDAAEEPEEIRVERLLAGLDEAHAKATPGPWVVHPSDRDCVIGDVSGDGDSYLDVADTYAFRSDYSGADAALIASAVNALPRLTAAVRAALALTDELVREHKPGCCAGGDCLLGGEHTHPDDPVRISELAGLWSDDPPPLREHRMVPCPRDCNLGCPVPIVADRLRSTVTAALGGAS